MEETLYQKLLKLSESDEYPFHMPGHKRNVDISPFREMMKLDITEIEGFDNLHHPEGILKAEQEFAAQLYHTDKTFYLVNGSTCGVLAAICSCVSDGDTIIMARNAHKSAYHAVYLKDLRVEYIFPLTTEKGYPEGPVNVQDIADSLDRTGAKLVFITSPSYEGIVSDIKQIAEVVHEKNAILIVDEAHGAHLGFHSFFPASAVSQGADLVIQSLHKTLPSMTQTALLHVCGHRVDLQRLKMNLSIFQTSSPSYVFMASMSLCLHNLSERKEIYFDDYVEKIKRFCLAGKEWKNIELLDANWAEKQYKAKMDPSKLVLYVNEFAKDESGAVYNGKRLAAELLGKYHLQMEMIAADYVLAMTSISDTQEGFNRLEQALTDIDAGLQKDTVKIALKKDEKPEIAEGTIYNDKRVSMCSIKEAIDRKKRIVQWKDAVGQISGEYIYLYPPGYPIITPGERITKAIWEKIQQYKVLNLNVQGLADYTLGTIAVL